MHSIAPLVSKPWVPLQPHCTQKQDALAIKYKNELSLVQVWIIHCIECKICDADMGAHFQRKSVKYERRCKIIFGKLISVSELDRLETCHRLITVCLIFCAGICAARRGLRAFRSHQGLPMFHRRWIVTCGAPKLLISFLALSVNCSCYSGCLSRLPANSPGWVAAKREACKPIRASQLSYRQFQILR